MRGFSFPDDSSQDIHSKYQRPIIELLQEEVGKRGSLKALPPAKSLRLYYVRQTNGATSDGRKVVYYFEPEFIFALDIGQPRLALVSIPYRVPTEKDGLSYRTIGRGDGEFPEFKEATILSGAGYENSQILYAAKPGVLLIGAKENVTEDQLRRALENYVSDLQKVSNHYLATIPAFNENVVANRIANDVAEVRYAELSFQLRNNSGPWWVDRLV